MYAHQTQTGYAHINNRLTNLAKRRVNIKEECPVNVPASHLAKVGLIPTVKFNIRTCRCFSPSY